MIISMDYYYNVLSAPCRAGMLTAKAVEIELNLKPVDLLAGKEQLADVLTLNPQHTLPTLVDGDFVLWESSPICTYLATKYGKTDSLYPRDAKTCATVNRLLYFDLGTLYRRFGDYAFPPLCMGTEVEPHKLDLLQEALRWLNQFLAGHEWAVGNNITVADIVLVATVSTIEAAGVDLSMHDNVVSWLERCKSTLPGYTEVNQPGVEEFAKTAEDKLKKL
ncbi:glutathione S-transferase 1-like isoform X1 [Cherax quadricarinatus]